MQQTTNFQLPSWEASDRILRTDFNDMTEKLDAALGEHAAVLATVGNCRVYTTSYTGTGTYGVNNPSTLVFDDPPVLVMITGSSRIGFTTSGCPSLVATRTGGNDYCTATWSEDKKTLSWFTTSGYADSQLNESGQTYQVIVLVDTE